VSGGRNVRIEKLAPTGEGIARTADGVGFVDRALPGELVATTLYEVKKRFWRGNLRAVLEPSPDRVAGPHADCAGCDWAHAAPEPARRWKRELFLETMRRLGGIEAEAFGELPLEPSGPGYRLRTRLHVADGAVGYYAPRTHRVVPAAGCEAIAVATRALLPRVEEALAMSRCEATEIALLESLPGDRRLLRVTAGGEPQAAARLGDVLAGTFDGVRLRGLDGRTLLERGDRALTIAIGPRAYSVSADSFFQGNRFLVESLFRDVERAASAKPATALDAYGGVGLFAGALLEAGHEVQSVESDAGAVADARRTAELWTDAERWRFEASTIERFLEADDRAFDCVVADPPRAGLGGDLARELGRRARRRLLYVSCDPATLARDLSVLLAGGFEIGTAKLYDLFAFTHRVEALVVLERAA
jgi:tRNA/tmRNA/rRNA uracil-C5-methylase (TrmA/RlmC/RlmD family)